MTLLNKQRILGIESSGFYVSVGLMDKGVPKGLIYLNDGTPGSQSLLATIDRLLNLLKIDKTDLDGICVTRGPGAFTSLRICLSTAEALGLGLNIPIYGVNTLILTASTVPFYGHTVKVIQNAYKGEFYTASYDTRQGAPIEKSDLSLTTPKAFYDTLEPDDLIIGSGIQVLKEKFNLEKKRVKWNMDFHRSISGIGVIEYFLTSEAKEPAEIPLEPIYIRLSDAELNYSKQFR